jgi:hypothetical protein
METTLFTCMILEQDDEEPFVQVYWARAVHLGAAIQMILDSARSNGLRNPVARECDPYDIENLRGEVAPAASAEVFWSTSQHFFPPAPLFDLPTGIISSCLEGDHDKDEIAPGFTMTVDDEGLTTIWANMAQSELFQVYSALVSVFPEYRVFWYVLHAHWEDEKEERFLVNEGLSTPAKILDHLRATWVDSVQNGFVTLTAYLKEGATNIKISDHKGICVATRSQAIAERCANLLVESGYPEVPELVSIDCEMHHWHYRLPGSRSKTELAAMLKSSGFVDWVPGSGN